MNPLPRSENSIVLLIGAVQFVNVLDFMMVMPLGPDFARGLHIDPSSLGIIGGSYTAAATVAGLAGSLFLEKFDRRKALAVSMAGLVVGTALGGLAFDLRSLVLARILAGLFGGPATSIAFAIIADVVPPERRGRAMGRVMSGFAVASTIGVPVGLQLATWGTWRTPFFAVAGLGLAVAALSVYLLPPMGGHLLRRATDQPAPPYRTVFTKPLMLLAYLLAAALFMSNFLIIPSISPYVQLNLGFPRDELPSLYFYGGITSFVVTNFTGRLIDRFGAFPVAALGSVGVSVVIWAAFGRLPALLSVPVTFVLYFLTMGLRNVPFNTLMTLVPGPHERARFMSVLSAVQHLAAATGAFVSSLVLVELPDHHLAGMQKLAWMSLALTLAMPPLLWVVQRRARG